MPFTLSVNLLTVMLWLAPPLIYVLSTYRKRSTKLITMRCSLNLWKDIYLSIYLELLENLFYGCYTVVKLYNVWSSAFEINFGVRQGSVLSPFLCALYLDNLSKLGSSLKVVVWYYMLITFSYCHPLLVNLSIFCMHVSASLHGWTWLLISANLAVFVLVLDAINFCQY